LKEVAKRKQAEKERELRQLAEVQKEQSAELVVLKTAAHASVDAVRALKSELKRERMRRQALMRHPDSAVQEQLRLLLAEVASPSTSSGSVESGVSTGTTRKLQPRSAV